MRRSLSTILGLGMVGSIFMAVMSMFYLQQIPTKEDAEKLEEDIRREHSLYLSAASDIEVTVLRPQQEGDRTGIRVVCSLRPDLRREPQAVFLYLTRIADSILVHPDWRGRIAYATVAHAAPLTTEVTRQAVSAKEQPKVVPVSGSGTPPPPKRAG